MNELPRMGFRHFPHADLTALMQAADVMIADFGSAREEFCLLDRPLVFFRIEAQAARSCSGRRSFWG